MNEEAKVEEEISAEEQVIQLTGKLKYAQKLITNLQTKLNEQLGIIIQLEAKLQLAEEDHQGITKQLEEYGLNAQKGVAAKK